MKRLNLSSVQDYLALIHRRKSWALIPFALLSAAIIRVGYLLPSVYVSESSILVEQRELPADFVRDLINVSPEKRLREIQETVLSRTNLLRILKQFEAGLKSYRGLNEEKRVAAFRNDINMDFQTEAGRGSSVFSFKISYENQDPRLAQQITNRLASLFIEFDNRSRAEMVMGTTQFLNSELQKVSKELEEADLSLRNLKERYRDELPEQAQTNLRALDRLENQMRLNTDSLNRAISLRLSLERQITETPSTIVETVEDRGSARAGPNSVAADYQAKERAYRELRGKYMEGHPDVQRLKAELDRLKKEIPAADLADGTDSQRRTSVSRPNPLYQKLTSQLQETITEIASREKEKVWIQDQMAKYNQRLQVSPERQQDLASATRSYEESKKQYEELKGKLVEAKLAESLENKNKGTNFIILDPANFPLQPAKPNRLKIVLLGILFSLTLGLAMAFGVEFIDQKLWSQQEVERLLGVPVLVEIPQILSERDLETEKKKKLIRVLAPIVCTTLAIGMVYLVLMTPKMKALVVMYSDRLSKF